MTGFFCDYVDGSVDERCEEQCPICAGRQRPTERHKLSYYWMRRAEVAELKTNAKDAARYHWLRKQATDGREHPEMTFAEQSAWDAVLEGSIQPEEIDRLIDAALEEGYGDSPR